MNIVLAIIFIVGGGLFWSKARTYNEEYALPEGFKGCAYIVYNIQGTPPLDVKNGTIIYKFDHDGLLLTSSPKDFGWEGRKSSGFHKMKFYYIDENGHKVEDISHDMIGFHALGNYQKDGIIHVTRETFSVGVQNANCDTNYDYLLEKMKEK
jgi:hypothetical protein